MSGAQEPLSTTRLSFHGRGMLKDCAEVGVTEVKNAQQRERRRLVQAESA